MKKLIFIFLLSILLIGCAYASNIIEINGAEFEIPEKYQNGELNDNSYKLDDVFSIRCIDGKIPKSIGLWAVENEYSKDLSISGHPVRHYCQYNKYVNGNHSHAYFMSGESVYEISWIGKDMTKDIKQLIKNTPKSKYDKEDFFNALDEAVKIYKQDKIEKLNQDAEYNYIEAKIKSQNTPQTHDDTRFKEILLSKYYQ